MTGSRGSAKRQPEVPGTTRDNRERPGRGPALPLPETWCYNQGNELRLSRVATTARQGLRLPAYIQESVALAPRARLCVGGNHITRKVMKRCIALHGSC